VAEQGNPDDDRAYEDRLIQSLVPDPSAVPDARALFGFLGKSTREGFWRLYVSPDLDEYVEVPEDAMIHREQLAREQSALGGTVIWVKRDATLLHTRTVSREAQAGFLDGSIVTAYLRGAKAGALLGQNALAGLGLSNTDVTVCQICPHSQFSPVCTLATSCATTVRTDPGCGGRVFDF